jgi:hypothetical protein
LFCGFLSPILSVGEMIMWDSMGALIAGSGSLKLVDAGATAGTKIR